MKNQTLFKLMIGLLLFGHDLSAKEFFVSLNGNDANRGNIETPFRTLCKASEVVSPGDTVTIRGGVYELESPFQPLHSGKPGSFILYRSMPGEKVVFDGRNILYMEYEGKKHPFSTLTCGLVHIEKVSYVRFEHLSVVNSRGAGFIVKGPQTKNIDLIDCKVDCTYNSGIGLWYADSIRVLNCEVTGANNIDYRNVEVPRPGEAPHEAISICGARYFEIAGNEVHHCYKEGIDCKEVSRHGVVHHNYVHDMPRQAYYADAWFGLLEDIEFHSNVGHDCAWGFAISVEGKDSELRNVRFHHNILYDMKGAGILFGAWGDNRLRSDIHIYNNTIYKCGSPRWFSGGVGSIDILSKSFKDIYIYRNICDKGWDYEMGFSFSPEEVKQALKERNFVAAENLFESYKNRPSRMGQFDLMVWEHLPDGNTIGAPLYRNEPEKDFVPEELPEIESSSIRWKYEPSPWYGALKPIKTIKTN